jgi:hypothetical protein
LRCVKSCNDGFAFQTNVLPNRLCCWSLLQGGGSRQGAKPNGGDVAPRRLRSRAPSLSFASAPKQQARMTGTPIYDSPCPPKPRRRRIDRLTAFDTQPVAFRHIQRFALLAWLPNVILERSSVKRQYTLRSIPSPMHKGRGDRNFGRLSDALAMWQGPRAA